MPLETITSTTVTFNLKTVPAPSDTSYKSVKRIFSGNTVQLIRLIKQQKPVLWFLDNHCTRAFSTTGNGFPSKEVTVRVVKPAKLARRLYSAYGLPKCTFPLFGAQQVTSAEFVVRCSDYIDLGLYSRIKDESELREKLLGDILSGKEREELLVHVFPFYRLLDYDESVDVLRSCGIMDLAFSVCVIIDFAFRFEPSSLCRFICQNELYWFEVYVLRSC